MTRTAAQLRTGGLRLSALVLVLGISLFGAQFVLAAPPDRDFTVTPSVPLVGQSATFTATNLKPGDSVSWDFDGDGLFEVTGRTVEHVFTTSGQQSVVMRVTPAGGGEIKVSKIVRVDTPPTASFSASPNPATVGETVQFNATASSDPDGTIARYEWDLDGNGSFETSTGSTPTTSQVYAELGTVSVKLRVTDNDGGTADSTVAVVVDNRRPIARFTASPNPALVGESVTFDAGGSSDPDGTIASYAWDLDNDGQFDDASGVSTSHSFATTGTYTVRLLVTDDREAKDTATLAVTVTTSSPANQLPVASFTASPNPAATGQTVQFDAAASSDPDGTISSYEWDLDGNGSFETSTGSTPTTSKAYADPVTVNIRLRVTDNTGASAEKTVTLVVTNRAPVASFTASPNPALVNQSVTFNASASSDPDGTIAGYAWDLDNDGQFDDAAGVTTSHSFTVAGAYTVRLAVTDNRGATDTATLTVTVSALPPPPVPNQPPVASFTASPNPAMTGETVQFNAGASSDPDGSIANYAWDLDGNGSFETATGTTATTSKAYANAGAVSVRLRVTDDDGASAEKTVTVAVENRPPVASFIASPSSPTSGQTVQFNAAASSDPDGSITGYEWDLDDDGQFDDASGVTASRSFATAGSHTVRLRVTDNLGASDVATSVVTVAGTPPARLNRSPVAFFTATPAVTTAGRTVQFNAAGSSDTDGTVVRYQWDLDGDGQFDDASGVAVARSFDVLGPHTVSLRVTDNDGATAVSSQPIGVFPETASASTPLALMTPFPVVRIAGRLAGRGARITRLEVRGAPRGATVTVRCRGGGCRYRQRSKPASSGRLRFRSFERRLRSGAVLRVFVTKPGKIGKYTSFKIRRRRAPLRRDLCVVSVVAKPAACASS